MRGKPPYRQRTRIHSGLIPACAGKTRNSNGRSSPAWAHPRVCGENPQSALFESPRTGSSPRVRGKHSNRRAYRSRRGLIPACAGKTTAPTDCSKSAAAHPRVCGENTKNDGRIWPSRGSSPRVRGKRFLSLYGVHKVRLIPACAGKTSMTERTVADAKAHPRVCGENARQTRDFAAQWGSSPRVRGKQFVRLSHLRPVRLIPACAGKTCPSGRVT